MVKTTGNPIFTSSAYLSGIENSSLIGLIFISRAILVEGVA
jgi:hypothetical protein